MNRVYKSVQVVDLIQQSLKQIQKLEVVHFSSVYNYVPVWCLPYGNGFHNTANVVTSTSTNNDTS